MGIGGGVNAIDHCQAEKIQSQSNWEKHGICVRNHPPNDQVNGQNYHQADNSELCELRREPLVTEAVPH